MKRAAFVAIAALFTTAGVARADETFRCPTGRLVSVGDQLLEARGRCGAPSRSSRHTEKQHVRVRGEDARDGSPIWIEQAFEVAVEEWFFDQGSERFVRALRFENGRLTSITTGRYGGSGDK
jgi:hypothetical protein